MTKYFCFCRGYGDAWAYAVLIRTTDYFTRRDYKQVLGTLLARAVSVPGGAYADVLRVQNGSGIPDLVLRIEVETSTEDWPAIKANVLVNDVVVRTSYIAE